MPFTTDNMIWLPEGEFRMGANNFYPEETPVNTAAVGGFWIDAKPVTESEFAQFIEDTGYITVAEREFIAEDYPGIQMSEFSPGALVFTPTDGPVDLSNPGNWWQFVVGANWRNPIGLDEEVPGDHPVVQVAFEDVQAYADWCGKDLPTEAEWEYAAKGGREGTIFPWGNELYPDGNIMTNTWEGEFPFSNSGRDGYTRTSPVGSYPQNDYGLFDMIGNVWEWTQDWWTSSHPDDESQSPCCAPDNVRTNPQGGPKEASLDLQMPEITIPRKVLKGGSHLCAANYCLRYRPAARIPQMIDTSASHIGFRCVVRS